MAKLRGAEAKLKRLAMLRSEPLTSEIIQELSTFLDDTANLVVADAAEIAGKRQLAQLASKLADAFDRFMDDSDKGCRAKIAILEALNQLDYGDANPFLRGIHHRQEPIFGTQNDTAGPLRAIAAFGLVRLNHKGVLLLLAELLLDKDVAARSGAVQALGASGLTAALPLLFFKARIGDQDPRVLGECLSALIRVEPVDMLPIVAEFLHSGDESVQEGAILAISESRRPEGLELLKSFWPQSRGDIAATILLAIGMMRVPGSIEFLLERLDCDQEDVALDALKALEIYRHNDSIRTRIAVVVAKRNLPAVKERFRKKFEGE